MVRKGRKPKRIPQETPDSIQGVRLSPDHRMDIEKALAPLLERERQFVLEFFRCLNFREAARLAGYSEGTVCGTLARMLRKASISNALETIRGIVASAKVSSAQERRETLTEMHRGRIHHFGTAGADGFIPNVGPENMNSAALAEITTRVEMDEAATGKGEGKRGKAAFITRIKLEPKVPAIKELNEMDGLYPRDRAEKDFLEALRGANGIRFEFDLSARRKGAKK